MVKGDGTSAAAVGRVLALAVGLLWAAAGAAASPALAGADSGNVAAVWVPKEVSFVYVGFTTKYSCDGLRDRMRRILLALGARNDLKVMGYNCMAGNSPETTPGVRIVMHVLQPATAIAGPTVAAQWKTVDVLADRDLFDAARDCELIAQLDRDVLPVFAARRIDYGAACSVHTPLTGGTRLKLDVLVPEQATGGRTAAR